MAKEKALAIRQAGWPDDHPEIANSLNNLGAVLQNRGDLVGAENPGGEALASASNNLGTLVRKQNRVTEALGLFQRAEAAALPSPGREHPTVAASWSNLGDLEVGRRNWLEAEPWYRKALAASEATLGPTHPQTLTIVENLGALFLQQEKVTGAEAETLLSSLVPELGAQPERGFFVLTEFAVVYWQRQDFERAERALGEAATLVRGLSV